MKTYCTVAGLFALAAFISSPAIAQVAGHYSGTTTDGNNIQFDVTYDSSSSSYSITGASIGFSATCGGGSGETLNTAWGFGLSEPIVNGKAMLNESNNYFYFTGSVYFTGNNVHGNVASRSPKLSSASTPPTKALYCSSAAKQFTGSLQPATSATTAKPAAIGNYVYDRKGRIIGVIAPH